MSLKLYSPPPRLLTGVEVFIIHPNTIYKCIEFYSRGGSRH